MCNSKNYDLKKRPIEKVPFKKNIIEKLQFNKAPVWKSYKFKKKKKTFGKQYNWRQGTFPKNYF